MEDHLANHLSESTMNDKNASPSCVNPSGGGSNKSKHLEREVTEIITNQDLEEGKQSSMWRKFPGSVTDAMTEYYNNQIRMVLAGADELKSQAVSDREAAWNHIANVDMRNYDNNLVQRLLMCAYQLPRPHYTEKMKTKLSLVNRSASGSTRKGWWKRQL